MTVKDGVDILNLDTDKNLSESESSLEMILISLCKAFSMKSKQAAALLTNNNQYLIMACIKGVKGGKYDPLLNWYAILEQNSETLVDLMASEIEQLPESAR